MYATTPRRLSFSALLAAALWLAGALPAGAQTAAGVNTCVTCHESGAGAASHVVAAFATDIHQARGFTCVNCHGGDATATEAAVAMAPAKGFKGSLKGAAGVQVCASCHSDANIMRKFAPSQRIDQAAEYATSVHGQRLADGDAKVATCVSCHNTHGIRAVRDAKSSVYPTNVAATCASCHADPAHMSGYTQADGTPLPTTQLADYQASVHFAAMTKKNDLSAPTCNDCHGNHGARPPGADAVVNVCGTCHTTFATKLQTSVHAEVFDRGCVECHGNHAVEQPTDTLLGMTEGALCVTCHGDDNGAAAATAMRASIDSLRDSVEQSAALVERLHASGMEVGAQELALREARSQLTLSRVEVHTFDPAAVTKVVDEGLAVTTQLQEAGMAATAELRFRRQGLAASMIAILLVVGALVAKIKQIERRQAEAGEPPH
ncbi:MAG TPA: cytochrome c3 family protein [Vicinamibacterales bacterium]|nr:cytochrome c3 family protein [Vicinamibacterales bacterium]